MFKRLYQLFRIARKLASSGALDTINEIYKVPLFLRIFFELFSVGSKKKLLTIIKGLVRSCAMRLKVWELLL